MSHPKANILAQICHTLRQIFLCRALGNVSSALQAAGLLNNTVFFVHTDNGGPGSHACNWWVS